MTELELAHLSVKVRERVLLDDLSLRVERGDFVALVGPNGAGKTTLLKTVLALRLPTSGEVRLHGKISSSLGPSERAALVAWLPQHVRADEPVTALETASAARFRFQEPRSESLAKARAALARVGAESYAERRVNELSGGERQRVAFACLLAQEANLLLFDEPANHLDPAQQLEIYRLLGELWREGRTIMCINHDVNLLNHTGDAERVRVVGMNRGRIELEARFGDAALPEQLGALFSVHMHAIRDDNQRFIVPLAGSRP